MAEKSLKPEIRFSEFTEDWEQRKLDNQVMFYSGLTYSPADVIDGYGTLVLRSSNVHGGEITNADNVYVSPKVINSDNVQVGDIIVVVRNGSKSLIGKHAQIRKAMDNTVIGAFMTGIRYKQADFINALLSTPQFYSEIKKNMGATINQITTGAFREMQFHFPNTAEQKCIGAFFKRLDQLITLHQRELEKLKNIKKAMLEKMFPKDGANVPEIRFAGFTGAWEKRELGDITSLITKGTTPLDKTSNGNINFIKIENIDSSSGEITIKSKITQEEHDGYLKRSQLQENDILFSIAGTLGRVAIVKKEIVPANTNQALAIIRLKKGNINYITTYLKGKAVSLFIKRNPTVGAQPNLSLEQVEGLEISLPNINEQTQIGQFFCKLDRLITLQQRELEKLKNIKKAMLDKMFV